MSKFKLKHQRNSAILNNGEEKVLKQFPKVPIPTLKPMLPNKVVLTEKPKVVQSGYKQVLEELPKPIMSSSDFPTFTIPELVQADQWGNTDPLAKNIAMVTHKHNRQNAAKEAERLRQLEMEQLKKDALISMKLAGDKNIDWDATRASWLNSVNEGNEEVVDQSFENQLNEVVDNSDSAVLMMKKNSSTPFKMKHQSPLNDGVVSSSGGDNTIDYSNMTPEQKASLGEFWKSQIEDYGGIEPGSEGYTELVGSNSYAVYDDYAKGRRGENIKLDAPRWRFKGQGPEYDNPSGIHPNQLMRMYQGDDNVYE
tara:strand:- start:43 stop:972 length:930 start_codon:yes stop_codon:yes gene_type:complete